MIEFVLVVYMGAQIINQTQKFEDMDRCLYFATKLSRQNPIPLPDGGKTKITAICKPPDRDWETFVAKKRHLSMSSNFCV